MLQAINDRIKGWLGGVVVALISLPFALWGISSYFSSGEAPNAATIDGDKISVQELDYNLNRAKQELRSRNQRPIEDSILKPLVLEQLINKRILESYTHDAGYRVSDLQLFNTIKSLFSQDGEFDRAQFETMVRARGQTIPQFEDEIRKELRASHFSNGLRAAVIVTDDELQRLAKIEAQQREISLLNFSVASQQESAAVSEAEIQAAYESGIDKFMTEEQVSVYYVELVGEQLTKDIVLEEQQVKRAYDDYVAQLALKQQRRASHILLKPEPDLAAAMVQLETVQKSLAAGKSFASLAKQYSADTGSAAEGGDLGWVEHGQMVKPFEDALFALAKAGEVSGVVETQFGLHLIRLDEIRQQKPLSFAEKRAEIEANLKREAISGIFYDQAELLATSAYENPDNLDVTAKAIDVPVQKSELMTRNAGKGIAALPKVREAAFSAAVLGDNMNSEVIELTPEHVVVLRVNKHIPARKLPLQQVHGRLFKMLQREQAHAATLALAREAKDKIRDGTRPATLVTKGVSLSAPVLVKRGDVDKVSPAALRVAFEMPKPESGKLSVVEAVLDDANVAVIILHKVLTPETVEQSQLDMLKRRRMADLANTEYEAALAEISAGFDVHKNTKVLE